MIFKNRYDAGQKLALRLANYRDALDTIVLGLPRGGVVIAYEVAKSLHLPLDVTCPRKIGSPINPELGIGAITETGETFLNEDLIERLRVPREYIQKEMEKEQKRAMARIELFRKNKPPLNLTSKSVILVDDGLATGSTMKAAIKSVRARGVAKVIVAIPVASQDSFAEVSSLVDAIVCLSVPPFFGAVGEFYENFTQTEDDEVIELLHLSRT